MNHDILVSPHYQQNSDVLMQNGKPTTPPSHIPYIMITEYRNTVQLEHLLSALHKVIHQNNASNVGNEIKGFRLLVKSLTAILCVYTSRLKN